MTASATKSLLMQLTQLTGLSFAPSDIFWPDAVGMACRQQTIRFQPHAQPIRLFKQLLGPLLSQEGQHRFIYYSNSMLSVERASVGIRSYLDASLFHHSDLVTIVGPYSREQKFHRTQLFLNPQSLSGSIGDFKAVGCATTRALGAAGWDSDSIHLVFSSDMPTSLLSVLQEKGRAGRRADADGTQDVYHVCFDLDHYLYLVRRVCAGLSTSNDVDLSDFSSLSTTIDEYIALQLQDFQEVLEFFLMPGECQHSILQRKLSNPFVLAPLPPSDVPGVVPLPPCVTNCQFCLDGGVSPNFERFFREGVQAALIDLFFGPNRLRDPTLDGDELLAHALVNYPNAQLLFYGSKAKQKPAKSMIKRMLLLLITARIVEVQYVQRVSAMESPGEDNGSDTRITYALIAFIPLLPSCAPVLSDDSRWAGLPLKVLQ
jgi:hypothetical protein